MSEFKSIWGFLALNEGLAEYNPRYFDEPEKFKPSRWYGVPADSEMFTAFSVGESRIILCQACASLTNNAGQDQEPVWVENSA